MAAPAAGTTVAGRSSLDRARLARELGLTGLVALGLTLPLVGFETVDQAGGLGVRTRFPEMLVAIALIMIGRLGFIFVDAGIVRPAIGVAAAVGVVTAAVLILWPGALPNEPLGWLAVIGAIVVAVKGAHRLTQGPEETALERVGGTIAATFRRLLPMIAAAAIAFAVILPFLPFAERRLLDLAILVLTYVMLGWGLNIVVGLAGLLDLGYVAFYAVGAYSYALLALTFDLSFWVCLPLAGAFAAAFGILLGFPVLRLRGDYLAIVTLGFGEIIRIILLNWYDVTKGPDGLSGIPRPSFFGLEFDRRPPEGVESFHTFFGLDYASLHRIIFLYYLILALALLTNWFTLRIRRLPVGRAWEALREDEIACRSLGINPTNTKLTAFAIGAMFGGFAGSFFATRQGFISPESFTFIESAVILSIVVLGGMGSQVGVVLAAVILIGLPEWFRELEQYRMLAFGAGMVFIMAWRPRGLMAHRDPTVRFGGGPTAAAAASEGSG